MANYETSGVNQRLKADPRWQQAWSRYRAAIAAAPRALSTHQQRNDDEGSATQAREQAIRNADVDLAKVFKQVIGEFRLPGQPQAWLLDPNGNVTYQEDHSLRNNMLMMGGISLMGVAGMISASGGMSVAGVEGAAAGLPASGVTALGSGAMSAVPVTAGVAGTAGVATTGAAATTSGAAPFIDEVVSVYGTHGAGNAATGLSYGDMVRTGLPVAGSVINGILQNRTLANNNDAMMRYYEQALAYEKEKDLYQRGIDKEAVEREENRYAGYQGRIAPFIANGTTANDRMAALMGLPARAGATNGGTSYRAAPTDTGEWESWFRDLTNGRAPTPDELTALEPQLRAAGASLAPNAAGVNGKIRLPGGHVVDVIEAAGAGGKNWQWLHDNIGSVTAQPIRTSTAPATPAAPAPAPATTTPAAYSPAASTGTGAGYITVVAPNGRQKQVPASERDHWVSRGATVLQGAA